MNVYFNENMTATEARMKLFTIVDGKSAAEIEAIKKEYAAIAPILIKRELKKHDGWMTSELPYWPHKHDGFPPCFSYANFIPLNEAAAGFPGLLFSYHF